MALTLAVRQRRRLTDGRCDENGGRPQASRLLPRATAIQPQAVSGRG